MFTIVIILTFLANFGQSSSQERSEHPLYIALLSYAKNNTCVGSLVRPDWILTAAKCIDPKYKNTPALVKFMGKTKFDKDAIYAKTKNSFIYDRVLYYPRGSVHDLGLLKLTEKLSENLAKPIYLDFGKKIPGNVLCKSYFWEENKAENNSVSLHKIKLDILPIKTCRDILLTKSPLHTRSIKENFHYCTRIETKVLDRINFGGPLICDERQFGVAAYGLRSDDSKYYMVWTKLSAYEDWIFGTVQDIDTQKYLSKIIIEDASNNIERLAARYKSESNQRTVIGVLLLISIIITH